MKKLLFITVSFCLFTANIAVGQFTKLLDFEGASNGSRPWGSLISDGTFLYGMTEIGGTNGAGTIFKIKSDGTGYTKLLDFTYANGSNPWGSLISDGTFLYGMTTYGGTKGCGTIFKIKPDGTGYVKLLDFNDATNGCMTSGNLFYDGTFLYGMAQEGGSLGWGTIFKIKPDGTGCEKLLDFDNISNGRSPKGSLISDGTFLYGTTSDVYTPGTIFKIKPDGAEYQKLHEFSSASNGLDPWCSFISDGTFLYGMTTEGGTKGLGTIFKIMPDGTGYVKLLDFEGTSNGSGPAGDLISAGTFLYGMTASGGKSNMGTIFKIMPDGTGYVKLCDLDGIKGSYPGGSLISDGTFLYGMTTEGGTNGFGTIFRFKESPEAINEMINPNNLKVYPNPADDYFTIESKSPLNDIIIVDAIGKVVYQQNTNNTKSIINTSALSKGIYLVKIFVDGQSSHSRLIINR
jgi:uncharacterized repeat protein (TIGR03803 family)